MTPDPAQSWVGALEAGALVLSFVQLVPRRAGPVLAAYGWQAGLVAAAIAGRGLAAGDAWLVGDAGVMLAASVALVRVLAQGGGGQDPASLAGPLAALAAACGLAALSVAAVAAGLPNVAAAAPNRLTIALCVVLLGGLAMLIRRGPVLQAAGFLSIGNGALLAATLPGVTPGLPVAWLALAGLVVSAAGRRA